MLITPKTYRSLGDKAEIHNDVSRDISVEKKSALISIMIKSSACDSSEKIVMKLQ